MPILRCQDSIALENAVAELIYLAIVFLFFGLSFWMGVWQVFLAIPVTAERSEESLLFSRKTRDSSLRSK
jgi:hypothetical protein